MPLYDCVMLVKPHVKKEIIQDLVGRVGKHVYARNGVLTNIKSSEILQLGYGIKKLDGRYFQGRLVQMTMMATPNINKELQYLNKDDRLLRWLLVKHRDTTYKLGFSNDEDWIGGSRYRKMNFLADVEGKPGENVLSRVSSFLSGGDNSDVEDDEDDYEDDNIEVKAEHQTGGDKNAV